MHNIRSYREAQKRRQAEETKFRVLCVRCMHPEVNCYCHLISPFNPQIQFVILMHKIEARRRIATGRLSHLCLEDSVLLTGHDFSDNPLVNGIISDIANHCVILYPGQNSTNLTELSSESRSSVFPKNKKLVVFVIDGTWNTARQMIRSRCFAKVPRVCFTPPTQSNFRVRKQPAAQCYSTLEAIHYTIELLGPSRGFSIDDRKHDGLLKVFDAMVERQLEYVRKSHEVNIFSRHRRSS